MAQDVDSSDSVRISDLVGNVMPEPGCHRVGHNRCGDGLHFPEGDEASMLLGILHAHDRTEQREEKPRFPLLRKILQIVVERDSHLRKRVGCRVFPVVAVIRDHLFLLRAVLLGPRIHSTHEHRLPLPTAAVAM